MLHKGLLKFFVFGITISFLYSCAPKKINASTGLPSSGNEVIYHVFQRSFYDSNGDMIGDLNGLHQKLDYLQDLGITSILLLPISQSVYYHNYFSSDFSKIDSAFGNMDDYISLVKEIHRRGMKVYMDMETQYVTEDHPWYKSALSNLQSPYSDYILFKDAAHTIPETIVFNATGLEGYNGIYRKIATVNLKSKKVLDYNIGLFKYWVDPNGDGKFDDGVDGFRFDHMMDNLDQKPQLTGLFKTFWVPLIEALKKVNPALSNVAEQADWNSWGAEYVTKGDVDRVFAFKLEDAIRSFKKNYLSLMADSAFHILPKGKQQVVFIENHDMSRFSYSVENSLPKLKIGAALNLLLGGVPSIYYGQEIGMYGSGHGKNWGITDGDKIPDREAFEWYKWDTGKGMATWYKNTGVWWDSTNLKPGDGISLEEEMPDPNSIFNFYKKMIRIRKSNPVISTGTYENLTNTNDYVFTFQRHNGNKAVIVAINLSQMAQGVAINYNTFNLERKTLLQLNGNEYPGIDKNKLFIQLPPYGIEVWQIN